MWLLCIENWMLINNFCMPSEKRRVTTACPYLAGHQKADGCVCHSNTVFVVSGCHSLAVTPYYLMSCIAECSHPAFAVYWAFESRHKLRIAWLVSILWCNFLRICEINYHIMSWEIRTHSLQSHCWLIWLWLTVITLLNQNLWNIHHRVAWIFQSLY